MLKRLGSDNDSGKHTIYTYAPRKTLARMHIHTQQFNKRVLQETLPERDYFQNRKMHSVEIWNFVYSL